MLFFGLLNMGLRNHIKALQTMEKNSTYGAMMRDTQGTVKKTKNTQIVLHNPSHLIEKYNKAASCLSPWKKMETNWLLMRFRVILKVVLEHSSFLREDVYCFGCHKHLFQCQKCLKRRLKMKSVLKQNCYCGHIFCILKIKTSLRLYLKPNPKWGLVMFCKSLMNDN